MHCTVLTNNALYIIRYHQLSSVQLKQCLGECRLCIPGVIRYTTQGSEANSIIVLHFYGPPFPCCTPSQTHWQVWWNMVKTPPWHGKALSRGAGSSKCNIYSPVNPLLDESFTTPCQLRGVLAIHHQSVWVCEEAWPQNSGDKNSPLIWATHDLGIKLRSMGWLQCANHYTSATILYYNTLKYLILIQ